MNKRRKMSGSELLKEKPAGIGNASGSKLLPSFDP